MNVATSLVPMHGEENPFFVEMKTKRYDSPALYEFDHFDLKLIASCGHHNITGCIDEVICSITKADNKNILIQPVKMIEKRTNDQKLLQVFYIKEFPTLIACPFVITFKVKRRSTVPNFINKMIDSNWSEELWAAAVNRKKTDVEFFVGEETFGAHRSLLSARSPVFAAMFSSGMKEAECGQVRIEDVDSVVFQSFLKFLYTGMFESSAKDKDLFNVADKYRVETLIELCRSETRTSSALFFLAE